MGPFTLEYDIYGEGEAPKSDTTYNMSETFTSSHLKCPMETIKLAKNKEGDALTSTLVKINGDYLVVDLSQGVKGVGHDFYLIWTTTGGVSLSEKFTI